MLFFALWCLAAAIPFAISTEYARGTFTPGNRIIFPVDMALKPKSMLTISGEPTPKTGCFQHTVNYHDFKKGLVALKSIEKGTCYIKSTTETYVGSKSLIEQFQNGRTRPVKQHVEGWKVPDQPLSSGKVGPTVGRKIAKFCTGYKVFVLENGKAVKSLTDVPDKYCVFNCGSCPLILF